MTDLTDLTVKVTSSQQGLSRPRSGLQRSVKAKSRRGQVLSRSRRVLTGRTDLDETLTDLADPTRPGLDETLQTLTLGLVQTFRRPVGSGQACKVGRGQVGSGSCAVKAKVFKVSSRSGRVRFRSESGPVRPCSRLTDLTDQTLTDLNRPDLDRPDLDRPYRPRQTLQT